MDTSFAATSNKYAPSKRPADRKSHGRAKVTNHLDLLPQIRDGRQMQARRFRDLVRAFISDAGGFDNLSEVKLGLLRRLASATVLAEDLETRAINGEVVDITTFCQLASTVVRLSSRCGVERVPRDVTSTDMQVFEAELARLDRLEAEDA
jgi:hypothetical protein